MSNGFLTWCAFSIAILINIVFFSKERIKNNETEIFKYMLIANVFESLFTNLIVIIALTVNNIELLTLLNRLDVVAITTWCSLMFYYVYCISEKNKSKEIKYLIIAINAVIVALSLILNVTIINDNGVMDSQGPLTTLGFVAATFYIVMMIITIFHKKSNNHDRRKYMPLYFLIIMIIVIAVLRLVIPQINFISILISFINLIMIFTIENPDMRVVEELIRNRKIIEQSSEEKSNFVFRISQGLKEEVKNVKEQVNVYREEKLKKNKLDEIIDNIDESADKIDYIINDVLGINSFDNNIKKIESSYNIYTFLENIKIRAKGYIKNDIDYKFIYTESMPKELYGDSIKLKQVLMSVLINAIQNTKEGYVHVDVSSITKYDKCRLIITIEDTGLGIDIKTINEILEQDKLEDEKIKIDKLDVDLYLAYRIIKTLGGTMHIKSEEKKGTEVTITVDQEIVFDEEDKQKEVIEKYIKDNRAGIKLLVVDDNEAEIRKIKKKLEYLGYDVSVSMYGQDVIDRIKNKESYEIILIDDEMKLMSGMSLLKELAKVDNKSKKVVMLEKDKLFIKNHYLKEGFNEYIDKSCLLKELEDKF